MALSIWNLAWSVTNQCNLKCSHCYASSGEKKEGELNVQTAMERIIEPARKIGTKYITLTGGEPFTRSDIFQIIDLIKQNEIGVSIATNGTLLNANSIQILSKQNIDRIQVSLEGHDEASNDIVRGQGTFKILTESIIPQLIDVGLFVAVSITPTIKNKNNMDKFIELCINLGVNSVSIRRFVREGRANDSPSDMELGHIANSVFLRNVHELKDIYGDRIKVATGDPLYVLVDPVLQRNQNKTILGGCTAGITSLAIDALGNIKPCTRANNLCLGNVLTDDLMELWQNDDLLWKLRLRSDFPGKCSQCELLRICGGCRASAMQLLGDIFDDDPNCWKVNPNNIYSKDKLRSIAKKNFSEKDWKNSSVNWIINNHPERQRQIKLIMRMGDILIKEDYEKASWMIRTGITWMKESNNVLSEWEHLIIALASEKIKQYDIAAQYYDLCAKKIHNGSLFSAIQGMKYRAQGKNKHLSLQESLTCFDKARQHFSAAFDEEKTSWKKDKWLFSIKEVEKMSGERKND